MGMPAALLPIDVNSNPRCLRSIATHLEAWRHLLGIKYALTRICLAVPREPPSGVSPRSTGSKASEYWICCRLPLMSRQAYLPLPIVRAFSLRSRLGLSVAPPFGLGVPH